MQILISDSENEKIHIRTLAAMNPAADSYESLFDTACRIGIIPAEMQWLFLSMTMNVLGGNVDDHNKNFSVNRHCMTINNKNSAIEPGVFQ